MRAVNAVGNIECHYDQHHRCCDRTNEWLSQQATDLVCQITPVPSITMKLLAMRGLGAPDFQNSNALFCVSIRGVIWDISSYDLRGGQ